MPRSKRKVDPEKVWRDLERNGKKIKRIKEEVKLTLNKEEMKKCRFVVTDQSQRLIECTVHNGDVSHGFRLWPIHLWELREGIIFHKEDGKWVEWVANPNNNLKRFED